MKEHMKIEFSADAKNEAFARMVISAFLVRCDPALSVMSEVRTAVSEAVTNAIVHAYKNKEDGRIVMHSWLDEERIVVEVVDFGCGIEDVEQAMKPFFTTLTNEERTGMGFSLMLSFMDKVEVMSAIEAGTTIRMEKRLSHEE